MVAEGAVGVAVKKYRADDTADAAGNLVRVLRARAQPDDDKTRAARLLAKQADCVGHVSMNLLPAALRFAAGRAVADGRHVEAQGRISARVEASGHVNVEAERPDPVHQAGV